MNKLLATQLGRGLAPTASVLVFGLGCSTLAGIDKDYREVDPTAADASVGGVAGAAGDAGTGGIGGVAGNSGGSGGVAGATGGAPSGGGTGGTVSNACTNQGSICLPEVPAGWTGPVALDSGATAPGPCSGDYPTPTTAGLLFANLQAPPATCGCGCANPPNAACAKATLAVTPSCSSLPTIVAVLNEGSACTPVSIPSAVPWVHLEGNFTAGSCQPQPSENLPPVSWGIQARACGGATLGATGSCAGTEICAPGLPGASKSCVYQDGNQTCPAGYGNKQVLYDRAADTRTCTTCSCGTATGDCTGPGAVTLHNQSDCLDAFVRSISLGECSINNAQTPYAKYSGGTPTNVSCAPSGGTPTGTAVPENPVTFCCTN